MERQQRLHDEAAKIAAELEQWRSPKLGTLSVSEGTYPYERDETAWLRGGDEEEAEMEVEDDNVEEEEEEEAPPGGVQTPHRPIERAGTPVMSNASQRGQTTRRRYINMMETPGEEDVVDESSSEPPVNVQSPWVPRRRAEDDFGSVVVGESSTPTAAAASLVRRGKSTMKGSHTDYRRYYEALLTYARGKRALKERMDLEQQHKALLLGQQPQEQSAEEVVAMDIEPISDTPWKAGGAAAVALTSTTTAAAAAKLVKDEAFLERDFLRSLNALCWDRATGDNPANDPARKEGNFWSLLLSLREQGLSCLIWEDDASSKRQHENSVQAFVQDLARQVEATPKELIGILHNDKSRPLILQRRQQILLWLEHCFQKVLPAGATRTRKATFLTNSQTFLTQDLPETDKDAEILHCALALILAGRLSDAQKLARDSGVPWRAAVWGGGQPHGYKEGDDNHDQATGNADRFLWKHMLWIQSEKLMADPAAMADEAAIAALLSCHLTNALSNASLRTWEHGFLSCVRCLMARTEDELLHQHNNNCRQMYASPRYPGTQHEDIERQVLQCTSELAGYDEADIVLMLSSSPYEQMQRMHVATDASASFLAGKSAILAFFQDAVAHIQQSSMQDDDNEDDVFVLRFLSHIAIYLDSLASCMTPILLDNITGWKNELVSRYVEVLASREDLWYMVVLYASLLPEKYLLETLPKILSVLESPKEREVVVGHLQEFMPKSNDLDVQVLRRVVQVVLQEHEAHAPDLKNASKLDIRKMEAILWLRVDDIHAGEALIWSNQLLRQFMLAGKFRSALKFVDDILRKDGLVDVFENNFDTTLPCSGNLTHAQKEFEAWMVYLDSLKILERWRHAVMEQAGAATSRKAMSPVRDHEPRRGLTRTETAIADRILYRNIVQSKRESMSSVVSAAAKASAALQGVLEFSGGWLWVEEDEAEGAAGPFGGRGELDELRAQLLPQVVQLFQDVCLDTSTWLSGSLDEAAIALNEDRKTALQAINETQESGLSSPMSPAYWARKALNIVQVVVSDTYKISSVFGPVDLKGVLDRATESAVDELVLQA